MSELQSWSTVVADYGWHLNLHATMIFFVAAIASVLPRTVLTARWRSMMWVVVFARLALPLSFSSPISMQNLVTLPDNSTLDVPNSADTAVAAPTAPAISDVVHTFSGSSEIASLVANPPSSVLTLCDALVAVWLTVALILVLRLFWIRGLMWRCFRSLSSVPDSDIADLTLECAAAAGLRRTPRVLCTTNGTGPAVAGWLRPVLLMPEQFLGQLSKQQIRLVILHELRHVASGDTVVSWLQHVLCAVYWWNPFVWLAKRNWRAEREMACDAWVLSKAGETQRRSYAETLLAIVESSGTMTPLLLTAGMVPFPGLLERRIRAMRKSGRQSTSHIVAGVLLLTTLVATGLTDRVRGATEPIAAKPTTAAPPAPKSVQADKPKDEIRRPVLVFAEHVILWERTEVLSPEQLVERLAELRKSGPVRPKIYQTTGFKKHPEYNGKTGTMAIFDMVGDQEYSLLSFAQGRTRSFYDAITSQADLAPDPKHVRQGKVLLPNTRNPATGAQVVMLPPQTVWPGTLNLSQRTFADPVNEYCAYTDELGNFVAYPQYDAYKVVVFHADGYAIQPGPLKDGTEFELTPWEKITFTSEGWKEHQKAEVWMKPDGVGNEYPGFSMSWISKPNQTVTLKVPLGNGKATHLYSIGGAGAVTGHENRFVVTAGQTQTIALPAMTDDERSKARAKLAKWLGQEWLDEISRQ